MKRYQVIYPWAIILAGLVVRLWNLTALPAWYDEAYTLLVARLPLDRLLQAVAGDVHPPLYYLIISGLIHATPLPYQLFALRLFSVVCSLASLAVAWKISGLLSIGKPARLVALALMGIHPVMIYYGQEGRMYAWLTLLVLIQCWALLRRKWWLLGLATLASLYTHNYGMFYTAILGGIVGYFVLQPIPVYTAGKDNVLSGPIGKILLAMGVPVGLFIPWLWVLSQQMGQLSTVGYWLPDITPGSVITILYRVVIGTVPDRWNLIALPLAAAGLLLCFVATRRWLGLWALMIGPVVLALGVSVAWGKPILLYRGLIPGLPFLALLAGIAFIQATGPGRIGRWLLLVPIVVGLGGVMAYPYIYDSKTEVAWPAETGQLPELVHMEDTSYITISAMYPSAVNYLLDAGCPEQPGGLSAMTRQALGYKIITPDQLPEHYYLAAVISTLSTRCHESTFHRLTDGQSSVVRVENKFGIYGIWER